MQLLAWFCVIQLQCAVVGVCGAGVSISSIQPSVAECDQQGRGHEPNM